MAKKKRPSEKEGGHNIWITPPREIALVHRYRPIGLDPCTEPSNPARAAHFFTEKDDGLSRSWQGYGFVFVNPPYSLTPEAKARGEVPPIRVWAAKIHEEAEHGVEIVALLPCGARFGTGYWQEHILCAQLRAVCFVRGRVQFIDSRTGEVAKQPNYDAMFYGFNVNVERFGAVFSSRGAVFSMKLHRLGALDGLI